MVLKIAFFIIVIGVSSVFATSSYSQVAKVSLEIERKSLEQVMDEIELQSEYYFIFNQKQIDVNRIIDIQAQDKLITDILPELFKDTNVNYAIFDRKILLTTDTLSNLSKDFTSAFELQQQGVSGTVTDASTDQIMAGVNILVKGTTVGAISDVDGKYSIPSINQSAILIFSFIGYVTQEVPVEGKQIINAALTGEVLGLDDVVVTGYGSSKKVDLTGSVSNIKKGRLLTVPSFNVGSALMGKVAGVHIFYQGAGDINKAPMIRIRGTNSINTANDPLFVVDGVSGVGNVLTTLSPNDIESIDVLKDASATSIYGARGSNGVVLITTKRGGPGKVKVNYNHTTSYNVMNRHYYTTNSDQLMYVYMQSFLNAEKYGNVNRAKDYRAGYATGNTFSEMGHIFEKVPAGSYFLNLIGKDGNYYAPRWNNDIESAVYQPSFSNSDYVNISGGSEIFNFGLSLRANDQNGLMISSYNKLYSAKFDNTLKIFKWLDLSSQVMYIQGKNNGVIEDGITRKAAEHWSILPNTRYPNDPLIYGAYANVWSRDIDFVGVGWGFPLYHMDQRDGYTLTNQTTGNIVLKAKVNEHLNFESNFGLAASNLKTNYYDGKYWGSPGTASITTSNNFYWQNENYLTYNNIFGGYHKINAVAGISWSKSFFENFSGSNNTYFDNFFKYHNIGVGAAPRPVPSSSDGESSLNSYFGRLNYIFKNKYLVTATGRFDGSSKFGTNNKYGFFPSVGLGWKVGEEGFFNGIDFISNLKLRATWGKTGNQEIGSYQSQQFISTASVLVGSNSYTALYPSSIGNDDLKWETTTQVDGGIDIGLWNGIFNLEIDYYRKETTDMLLDVEVPESTTTGNVRMNYGSVENKGWEIALNTYNIRKNNFTWGSTVLFTANRNKILKLGPTGADIFRNVGSGQSTSVLREGEAIGSYFGLVRLGCYGTKEVSLAASYGLLPGDLKFQDTNNDGKISLLEDGIIMGHGFPKWTMDINNSFTFKNFDASFDFRIVMGLEKSNENESSEDRQLVSGQKNRTLSAWRPDNQESMVAQVRPGNIGAYYQSYSDTHMIQDASHLRGQNATIGYTFSKTLLSRIGVQSARIYLSAQNFYLLTSKDLISYDPEGSSPNTIDPLTPNYDKCQYPNPSVYSFGIDINF